MAVTITRLAARTSIVGEGPVWNTAEQALYFVDVRGPLVVRHHPASAETRTWTMPRRVSGLAFREDGGAVVALADGVYTFDLDAGTVAPLALFPDESEASNDVKVDRRGRFFVATVDARRLSTGVTEPVAGLHRLDAGGVLTKVAGDINIGNGPCWSPDGGVFYLADSLTRTVSAYDYDLETGTLSNRRSWVNTTGLGGQPDGMTADSEGRLWGAVARGAKVVCYRPGGGVERVVDMPVPLPTSVAFGGPDLDRLFVTTHVGTVLGEPYVEGAGDLYVIDGLGAQGLPEAKVRA